METIPPLHHRRAARSNPVRPFVSGVLALASGIVSWWQLQRSLEQLQGLNDHLLKDIGMGRPPEDRTEAWWRTKPPP